MSRELSRAQPAATPAGPPRAADADASRTRQRSLALAAILLATVIWGTGYLFTRLLLPEIRVLTLSALRIGVPLVVLLPWALRDLRHLPPGFRFQWWRLALMGFLGIGVFYFAWSMGLTYASTVEAGLIFGAAPAITAVLAFAFLGERIGRSGWGGVLISVAGVGFIALAGAGGADGASNPLLGGTWMLVAALAWSSYVILGKRLDPHLPHLLGMVVLLAAGLVGVIPFSVAEVLGGHQGGISALSWLLLGYLALANGSGAYVAFNYGLKSVDASQAQTLLQLSTVVAVVTGVLVLDEPLTTLELAGGAAVLFGVWLTTRPRATGPS